MTEHTHTCIECDDWTECDQDDCPFPQLTTCASCDKLHDDVWDLQHPTSKDILAGKAPALPGQSLEALAREFPIARS